MALVGENYGGGNTFELLETIVANTPLRLSLVQERDCKHISRSFFENSPLHFTALVSIVNYRQLKRFYDG